MSSLSSAFQCKDLRSESHRQPLQPPVSSTLPYSLGLIIRPKEWFLPLKRLRVAYLAASPWSQDKVLFSQLTGGWYWAPLNPLITRCPSMDAKGHSWSVPPHIETMSITTEGPWTVIRRVLTRRACCLLSWLPYYHSHFVPMLSPCKDYCYTPSNIALLPFQSGCHHLLHIKPLR